MNKFKINTKYILDYISNRKISKASFCKQCHISTCTLNKILSGKTNINLLSVSAIARGIGVPFKQLFDVYPFN